MSTADIGMPTIPKREVLTVVLHYCGDWPHVSDHRRDRHRRRRGSFSLLRDTHRIEPDQNKTRIHSLSCNQLTYQFQLTTFM